VRRRLRRNWRAALLGGLLAVASPSAAQELPGTPSGDLPPTLRRPYPESAPRAPAPAAPREGVTPVVPIRRELPFLIFVPDLRLSSGYSDNIFITPDVLGFRTVSDGLVSVSPRLRALVRLSPTLGLIGDYSLNYTQFFSNGNTLQNAGSAFLGYRPTVDTHAELGIRGGTASVSEFPLSDLREGYVFLSGTYPLAPMLEGSLTGSVGMRTFPERTRTEAHALVLGIGPLQLPIGEVTSTEKGEDDIISNVGGSLSLVYAANGAFRAGYDFTDNNADVSRLDYRTHRLSLAAINAWSTWLTTQASYAITIRRFANAAADDTELHRKDALHEITLSARLTPRFLSSLWFSRSVALRIDYGYLLDRSNLDISELDRNYVSIGFEIGLLPFTGEQIGRLVFPGLYGMPPSKSVSSNAQP
jgi:hypothetical protein